jgi:hypothetical protein
MAGRDMSFDGSTALIGLRKIARLPSSLGDKSRYDMRIGDAASIWKRAEFLRRVLGMVAT